MRFIKLITIILLLTTNIYLTKSQDCINYWNFNTDYKTQYSIVPEGCFSKLISTSEIIEVYFNLIKGRDYKITIGSEYKLQKPIIKIYSTDDNNLLYDNTTLDTINVIEFEVDFTKKVKAIITLSNDGTKTILKDKNQYYSNILYPKTLRYCTGIKTETMITKR